MSGEKLEGKQAQRKESGQSDQALVEGQRPRTWEVTVGVYAEEINFYIKICVLKSGKVLISGFATTHGLTH